MGSAPNSVGNDTVQTHKKIVATGRETTVAGANPLSKNWQMCRGFLWPRYRWGLAGAKLLSGENVQCRQ